LETEVAIKKEQKLIEAARNSKKVLQNAIDHLRRKKTISMVAIGSG